MTRQLILHIGSPKCGSTYLQQVLLINRERLSEHHVTYPHPGTGHPGNGLVALNMTQSRMNHLFRDHPTLVLSHEDLFAMAGQAKALARFCAQTDVNVWIVAFLRPFSEFIYGDYSQFIKQHLERFLAEHRAFEGRSFPQFAVDRSRALNAVGFLRGWASLFPAHPPIVASHTEIRKVFEALLEVDELNWDIPRDRVNPSLRMEDCERITGAINTDTASGDDIRVMLHDALRHTQQPDAGRTPERTAWIEAIFSKQVDDLQRVFGFDNQLKPAA